MNKFLIVFLAVILIATSAFRVKTREHDEDHDLEDLLEACIACHHHEDESRLQQDDHCEQIREACEQLAEELDNEDEDDEDEDEDEDDEHHHHHHGEHGQEHHGQH